MSKKQSKATKQANMSAASERAAAIRAEHERKERRTRAFVIGAVVIAMLLIVVVLTYVMSRGDSTGQTGSAPEGVVDGYSVPMGADDAPVTVNVYEDYMCPYCGLFEQISSDRFKEYAESGDVQVRYHVVSFLDRASTDRFSTRAANATYVVLDEVGPEAAIEVHDAIFANQPAEGGAGISDEQLIEMAVEAGASEEAVRGPIEDLKYEQFVVNSTSEWSERGFTGTPAVAVNGEKIEFTDAQNLLDNTEAAIAEALGE